MKPTILFKDVSKEYVVKRQRIPVLSNVNFALSPGEVVGIIGKNGIGKSTLLKLACNIYPVTSGTISIQGTIRPLIELGDCFQDELTGIENIFLYGSFLKIPKRIIKKDLDKIIKNADLPSDFIHKKLNTYSTGMRARLAFSVALIADMDILILDEILSVGDTEFAFKSFNKIRELKEKGKTILVVSHSLEQIEQICSRVIYIKDKNIAFDGEPSQAIIAYLTDIILESEEVYLPEIEKNIFELQSSKLGSENRVEIENRTFSMIQELSSIYTNIIKQFEQKKITVQDEKETIRVKKTITELLSKLITLKKKLFKLSITQKEMYDTFCIIKENYYAQIVNTIDNREKINVLESFQSFLESEIISLNTDLKDELIGIKQQIRYLLHSERELVQKQNFSLLSRFGNNVGKIYCKNVITSIQELSCELLDGPIDEKKQELKARRDELISEFRSFLIENMDILHEPQFIITNCSLTDKEGNEKYTFSDDEQINISIKATTQQPLHNVVVGIGIYTKDGVHMSGPNSHFHGNKIAEINEQLDTTFAIEPYQLINDTFMLTISLHSEEDYTPYDIHDNFYFFKVVPKDIKDYGIIKLQSQWSFSLK